VSSAAEPRATPAVVAVVGRPNVGKSTLVNRIVGRQVVIVEDEPGVTRDRKELEADWLGVPFTVVDTGGWLPGGNDLDAKVSRQVEQAVRAADVVLLVVDASVGVTEEDADVAEWLRRTGKEVLLVANKADNERREADSWELLSLGMGEPWPVSALHGRRTGDLLDEVIARFPEDKRQPVEEGGPSGSHRDAAAEELPDVPGVAVVGRPNVGKSTLFNRLIGEDRAVVHDMPGTTRDAIDTIVETPEGPIRFVDTAGMRRKSRIDEGTEYYSLVRALRAIDDADVALLVIDATEGVTSQDQRLAERIDAAGCPVVVLLNKWDLLEDAEARADVTAELARKLYFIGDSPVLKVSGLTGRGVHKLQPVLADAIERYHRRMPTRAVNEVIAAAQQHQPAPNGARILYALQGASDPPTFTLFANRELPATYLRYIERRLREHFDLGGVPVKLRVRRRSS
jgi:GTP-binding protein